MAMEVAPEPTRMMVAYEIICRAVDGEHRDNAGAQ